MPYYFASFGVTGKIGTFIGVPPIWYEILNYIKCRTVILDRYDIITI